MRNLLIWGLLLCGSALGVLAQEEEAPYNHPLFTGPVQEVPESGFDQQHLTLALRVDPARGTVAGTADLRIRRLADSLASVVLHAAYLDVEKVEIGLPGSDTVPTTFARSGDSLRIDLDLLAEVRGPIHLVVHYRATPADGLFFRQDRTLAQPYFWTENLPERSRYWFPSFDHPSDKFTATLRLTVPAALRVLAIGDLTERLENPDRTITYVYEQATPLPSHLLGMAGAAWAATTETALPQRGAATLPLTRWAAPEHAADMPRTFAATPAIAAFFAERLDLPLPWPYRQAVLPELYDAIQTSPGLSLFDARVLVDARALPDAPPAPTVTAALARQWFGALVTADHWADVWLQDAYAAYLPALFLEATVSDTAFALAMYDLAEAYFTESLDYRRPLVWDRWELPTDLSDAHSHAKGAWTLHMLRQRMGEDRFWAATRRFLTAHRGGSTETGDFQEAFEAAAPEALAGFFDEWVYVAGHPEIRARYTYDAFQDSLVLFLEQTQEGYLVPEVFDLDLEVAVYALTGRQTFDVSLRERTARYSFPVAMQPRFVRIDPGQHHLVEASVEQTATAWVAQLRYAEDAPGRLKATRALTAFADNPDLLIALGSALRSEPVPAVRAAILGVIAAMPPTPDTARLLTEAYGDANPVVRAAAVYGLGHQRGIAGVTQTLLNAANNDASYRVLAATVEAFATLGAAAAEDVARAALITPSHEEWVRTAGFRALDSLRLDFNQGYQLAEQYLAPKHPRSVRQAALTYFAALLQREQATLTEAGVSRSVQRRRQRAYDRRLNTAERLLRDDDFQLRIQAAFVLAHFGTEAHQDVLDAARGQARNTTLAKALADALTQLRLRLTEL